MPQLKHGAVLADGKHEEFVSQYTRAEAQADHLADEIVEIADDQGRRRATRASTWCSMSNRGRGAQQAAGGRTQAVRRQGRAG